VSVRSVRRAGDVPFTGPAAFGDAMFSADSSYCAPQGLSGSGGCLNLRPGAACFKAGRKSPNDEDDKFSLPTGSSLIEDIFKVAPRGFIIRPPATAATLHTPLLSWGLCAQCGDFDCFASSTTTMQCPGGLNARHKRVATLEDRQWERPSAMNLIRVWLLPGGQRSGHQWTALWVFDPHAAR
jgi:hypothetical protein